MFLLLDGTIRMEDNKLDRYEREYEDSDGILSERYHFWQEGKSFTKRYYVSRSWLAPFRGGRLVGRECDVRGRL